MTTREAAWAARAGRPAKTPGPDGPYSPLEAPVLRHLPGIRIAPFAGRVRVLWGDVLLADSARAVVVHEVGHPPRHYLPPDDVRTELLEASSRQTYCPHKGHAAHWSVATSGGPANIAWSYPAPLPGMEGLTGLIAFYDGRVDVAVEGVSRPRSASSD
jgi:uncharacterized protein (DUF427 family)